MEWLHAEGAMDCVLQVRGALIVALAVAVGLALLAL